MRRIRICHCIDDLSRCGAQYVVRYLVTHLDPSRFEPCVYTFRPGPVADEMREEGVLVRHLRRSFPKLDLPLLWRLRKYLQRDRIDILHTHLFGAILHGMMAGSKMRALSKVITLHADRPDNFFQEVAYPFLLSQAQRVVGVSEDTSHKARQRYSGLNRKLITIPNGIDIGTFSQQLDKTQIRNQLKLPVEKHIVGTIGRLTDEKGHSTLIESFARVKRVFSQAH